MNYNTTSSRRRYNTPVTAPKPIKPEVFKPTWLNSNGPTMIKLVGILAVGMGFMMGCAQLMQ